MRARGLLRAYPGAPEQATLRDVQHALARERGHESWIALTRAVADGSAARDTTDRAARRGWQRRRRRRRRDPRRASRHSSTSAGRCPAIPGLRTALHFGVGHEAVVRTLLERGADPNIRDEGDNAYPDSLRRRARRPRRRQAAHRTRRGSDRRRHRRTNSTCSAGRSVSTTRPTWTSRATCSRTAPATRCSRRSRMGDAGVVRELATVGRRSEPADGSDESSPHARCTSPSSRSSRGARRADRTWCRT